MESIFLQIYILLLLFTRSILTDPMLNEALINNHELLSDEWKSALDSMSVASIQSVTSSCWNLAIVEVIPDDVLFILNEGVEWEEHCTLIIVNRGPIYDNAIIFIDQWNPHSLLYLVTTVSTAQFGPHPKQETTVSIIYSWFWCFKAHLDRALAGIKSVFVSSIDLEGVVAVKKIDIYHLLGLFVVVLFKCEIFCISPMEIIREEGNLIKTVLIKLTSC